MVYDYWKYADVTNIGIKLWMVYDYWKYADAFQETIKLT